MVEERRLKMFVSTTTNFTSKNTKRQTYPMVVSDFRQLPDPAYQPENQWLSNFFSLCVSSSRDPQKLYLLWIDASKGEPYEVKCTCLGYINSGHCHHQPVARAHVAAFCVRRWRWSQRRKAGQPLLWVLGNDATITNDGGIA